MKRIVLLLTCFSVVMLHSQDQENRNSELELTVSLRKNHVVFECSKGCNFSYLSFDAYRNVFLNENAMVQLQKNPAEAEKSNFIVQYSKKGNQINLKGIKGVDFQNITLDMEKTAKYSINESGEIKKTKINTF